MAYKSYQRGSRVILKDQRKSGEFALNCEKFAEELEALGNNIDDIARKMLASAEPVIVSALDAEMIDHPKKGAGTLRQSLKSTGPVKTGSGFYYLAYRATGPDGSGWKRSNQDKMIYLCNREYIYNKYAIPAYDVVGDAVSRSRNVCEKRMQSVFDEEVGKII